MLGPRSSGARERSLALEFTSAGTNWLLLRRHPSVTTSGQQSLSNRQRASVCISEKFLNDRARTGTRPHEARAVARMIHRCGDRCLVFGCEAVGDIGTAVEEIRQH
jgi:hypothetical protein